jgi:beta-galactosidase
MLLTDNYGKVRYNGSDYLWNTWAEILSPYPGTNVLACYTDQFFAGKAAVTERQLGKGNVTFIGVASKDGLLERQVVRSVYEKAGVAIENLPNGVFTEWRDGFFVAVNYTDNDYKIAMPVEARILSGSNPLKPANAIVWTTKPVR